MLEINKIHHGDCLELMKQIPDNSIDLICTDPPYGINFGGNERDKISNFVQFTESWVRECFRVLREGGSFYGFMARSNVAEFKLICDKYGSIKNWITRERTKGRGSSKNFKSTKEEILYYIKGKGETRNEEKMLKQHVFPYVKDGKPRGWFTNEEGVKCRWTGIGNVRHYTTPFFKMKEYNIHPTQKPELMIERIILSSSNEGDVILDPFMGSGTTAKVCKELGRSFIGIEKEEEYVKIAQARINNFNL